MQFLLAQKLKQHDHANKAGDNNDELKKFKVQKSEDAEMVKTLKLKSTTKLL